MQNRDFRGQRGCRSSRRIDTFLILAVIVSMMLLLHESSVSSFQHDHLAFGEHRSPRRHGGRVHRTAHAAFRLDPKFLKAPHKRPHHPPPPLPPHTHPRFPGPRSHPSASKHPANSPRFHGVHFVKWRNARHHRHVKPQMTTDEVFEDYGDEESDDTANDDDDVDENIEGEKRKPKKKTKSKENRVKPGKSEASSKSDANPSSDDKRKSAEEIEEHLARSDQDYENEFTRFIREANFHENVEHENGGQSPDRSAVMKARARAKLEHLIRKRKVSLPKLKRGSAGLNELKGFIDKFVQTPERGSDPTSQSKRNLLTYGPMLLKALSWIFG